MLASDYDQSPHETPSAESVLRRKLASLRLVEPLMLAALYRPGIGEDASTEVILEAQQTLIFRVIHLTDRILDRLQNHSDRRPFDRYTVAREIVGLVAAHWKTGSDLTADDMAILAEQAVANGIQLLRDLKEQPYKQGDDAMERLSSAISVSARIMLCLRGRATLGHEVIDLSRKMTNHLAQVVIRQSERLRAKDSEPAIKTMLRIFSDYYPILWDEEIRSATNKFKALQGDPEAFAREAESCKVWPLDGFFGRVNDAVTGCLEMASAMQTLLEQQAEPDNSSPNP